jgi:hypothetical protein
MYLLLNCSALILFIYSYPHHSISECFDGFHLRRIIDAAIARIKTHNPQNAIAAANALTTAMKHTYKAALHAEGWLDRNSKTASAKTILLARYWLYWQWQSLLVLRHEARLRWEHPPAQLEVITTERSWPWICGWRMDHAVQRMVRNYSDNCLMPDSSEPSEDEYSEIGSIDEERHTDAEATTAEGFNYNILDSAITHDGSVGVYDDLDRLPETFV